MTSDFKFNPPKLNLIISFEPPETCFHNPCWMFPEAFHFSAERPAESLRVRPLMFGGDRPGPRTLSLSLSLCLPSSLPPSFPRLLTARGEDEPIKGPPSRLMRWKKGNKSTHIPLMYTHTNSTQCFCPWHKVHGVLIGKISRKRPSHIKLGLSEGCDFLDH